MNLTLSSTVNRGVNRPGRKPHLNQPIFTAVDDSTARGLPQQRANRPRLLWTLLRLSLLPLLTFGDWRRRQRWQAERAAGSTPLGRTDPAEEDDQRWL